MNRKILVPGLAIPLTLGLSASVLADQLPSREEMWEIIKKQQQQIEALQERLGQTRDEVKATVEKVEQVEKNGGLGKLSDKVEFSGLIKLDVASTESYAGVDSSDITLNAVELGADVNINPWVNANILFKYQEDTDGNRVLLDAASITVGDTEKFPVYAKAGMYPVPFGNFTTNMVSDPLTKTMGETKETTVQAGFEANGFYGAAWTFNGSTNKTGKGNFINQFGANLGYAFEQDDFSLDVAASWSSSMDDADTIGNIATVFGGVVDHTAAYGLHAILGLKGFQLVGEYLTAAESFDSTNLAFNGHGAKPAAWNAELAYTFDLLDKPTTVATGYQGTSDALALSLPEARYLLTAGMEIFEQTTLQAEYRFDEDYDVAEGGTGNNADTATMRLMVEF
ncbi:MAG: LbtU family siderophore porin [Magnetococcales bacterium]|nr:LbtU family siderophore porin [Magnetococcales bacterium]